MRTGVGYDSVDVDAATAAGVSVSNLPGVNAGAVAEYTLALLLAQARRLVPVATAVAAGGWPREGGTELRGKTLGLVGLAVVAICTVLLVVASVVVGRAMGEFIVANGTAVLENPDPNSPEFQALAQSISGWAFLLQGAVLGGIVGWIVSIVAAVRRAGRGYAIGGILLGIAAPIIGMITLFVVLAPYAQVA